MIIVSLKNFIILNKYPSMYGFNLHLRDRLNLHYTLPNEENLSFTALMIYTLIIVTHSNIFTFDNSNIFINISSQFYKTFCYHISIHSFGKIFRVLFILGFCLNIGELLRFL
jgi:hypothetical protein